MSNYVYIAVSLEGFIARLDGSINWLTGFPAEVDSDYGYNNFIRKIDAVIMGRHTYNFVKDIDPWPYDKPLFVLSSTLKQQDIKISGVSLTCLTPPELVKELSLKGLKNLYIDGGKTIQSFLHYDLIDELIITTLPVLIGSGLPLFGRLENDRYFKHVETDVYENGFVKSRYKRIRG